MFQLDVFADSQTTQAGSIKCSAIHFELLSCGRVMGCSKFGFRVSRSAASRGIEDFRDSKPLVESDGLGRAAYEISASLLCIWRSAVGQIICGRLIIVSGSCISST